MKYLKPDTTKLDRARKVLKAVRIPWSEQRLAWVDAFNNCREQGYSLVVWDYAHARDVWFTVSEYRNTDDIVVYSGTGHKPASGVDDASYATKRFFSTEQKAADYISEQFA